MQMPKLHPQSSRVKAQLHKSYKIAAILIGGARVSLEVVSGWMLLPLAW